jgi:hypothetical protein
MQFINTVFLQLNETPRPPKVIIFLTNKNNDYRLIIINYSYFICKEIGILLINIIVLKANLNRISNLLFLYKYLNSIA